MEDESKNKFNEEIKEKLDILQWVLENMNNLNTVEQLNILSHVLVLSDKLEPIYRKYRPSKNGTFIIKL